MTRFELSACGKVVICVRDVQGPSDAKQRLTAGMKYDVIGVETGSMPSLWVMNDKGDIAKYDMDRFVEDDGDVLIVEESLCESRRP
jgi:hypothetical protein